MDVRAYLKRDMRKLYRLLAEQGTKAKGEVDLQLVRRVEEGIRQRRVALSAFSR